MNIEYLYGADLTSPRARVWCKSSDLTKENDGTYTFKQPVSSGVGTGSEIIVIDAPGLILFYDAEAQVAYDWTAEA